MTRKRYHYFPSFSAGAGGAAWRGDFRFKDDSPYRFYDKDYPEKYRHPFFLITAGHDYKQFEHRERYGFTEDTLVFGDSGGFQIASGAIEWDISIRETIFKWLEHNSDIAMNLDIPTVQKYAGKFKQCLDISYDNFKYFEKHQTGKTKFLNVMQGENEEQYKHWYDTVKDFQFQGWGIGGGGKSYKLICALTALIAGGEHFKDHIEMIHFLGISKIPDFFYLSQIQKSLDEVGSNVRVMTDSSSPNNASRFGFYYTGFDLKTDTFRDIRMPRTKDMDEATIEQWEKTFGGVPIYNEIDAMIYRNYTPKELIEMKSKEYAAVVLHNFSIFQDAMRIVDDWVHADPYFLEEVCSTNTRTFITAIDEIVKAGPKAWDVFAKYKKFFLQYQHKDGVHRAPTSEANEYF